MIKSQLPDANASMRAHRNGFELYVFPGSFHTFEGYLRPEGTLDVYYVTTEPTADRCFAELCVRSEYVKQTTAKA